MAKNKEQETEIKSKIGNMLFKRGKLVLSRVGTFLDGIDQVIYTPLRLISVFSQATFNLIMALGRGIVVPIALAVAGIFGLFYAAYDTWRELRDKQYHRYRVIGKILLTGTDKESGSVWTQAELDKLSRLELNHAIKSYLNDNKKKLEEITQDLFSNQYEVSFDKNKLVLKTIATDETKPKKPLTETIKNSLLAIWAGLWNLLAMYSMVYWIVFMSAMIAGKLLLFSGGLALAFSPFIAFAVPAIVTVGCLAPLFIGDIYRFFVPNDQLVAEKAARIQLLKAFWLRKKHAKEAKHKLDEQGIAAVITKQNLSELPNDEQSMQAMREVLQGKQRDIWIRTAINAIKVYVVSVFILWPLTDMLSFFSVAIPGLNIITFVLPLVFAAIYTGYSYQKEKQAYVERGVELESCKETLTEINGLTREAKRLKNEIRKLSATIEAAQASNSKSDEQTQLKMPVMPQHDQDDIVKQMTPQFEAWNQLDHVVDTSRNIIGPAGTGAFIVRSFMLMSPIVLIIDPTSLSYMIALGVACAVVAAIWVGVSLWEYQHNKQRKLATTYLQEIGLRREALRQEVKVLTRYQEVLKQKLENAPKPVSNATVFKGVFAAIPQEQQEQEQKLSPSPTMLKQVGISKNPNGNG